MEKTFTYQNTSISYHVYGTGQPVVLLHGFGEDRSIWANQVKFLEPHCRLIVPDLPGTGKSALLANATSIDDYADCIFHLLQHEQIKEPILLGHSLGGYITLAIVEKFPAIVKAFGLIHSTAFADSEEKKKVREKGVQMINEYGSYAFLKNTIPNLFSDNFKKKNNQVIQDLILASSSFSPEALIQYYLAMKDRPDRTSVLQNATVPVLFVIGKEDVAAPLDDLKKQTSLPKQPYVHVMEDVGHMGMLEATDQLNEYMLEFINR
ncbi:alpha/beta fold hydrolase [Aridibaculum aurantiacum]|uniref:alpha/beta fold hydrolase n=1 Tax=Aridibaculum aurantiacum TaxID=2810307 RepID=UPI001A975A5D|nr:alpha/beta hydrolase [Aridibaculum aurantiacum]